jgi:hypothetical protein
VTSWIDKISSCAATFMAFSSFVTCKPNIKHVLYFSSFVTKKFSCAASKRQARLNRKICACVKLAELKTRHELVILIRHVVFNSASCTHAQIFLRRKCRKCCPHTRKFCRSNLSRITSTRDKCARARRA